MTRICEACGQSFDPDKPERKYCSAACYHKHRAGKPSPMRRKPVRERECERCGTVFQVGGSSPRRLESLFCSRNCAQIAKYRQSAEPLLLSETDAAYLAGFVDGEASIGLVRDRKTLAVRFNIGNIRRDVLEWITQVTGVGQVYAHGFSGKAETPNFAWNCNGRAAASLLRQLLPYLKIKNEQAALVIKACELMRGAPERSERPWQAEILQQMRALNRRGPKAEA